MGRFVGGLTFGQEQQQQTQVESLKEPSSLEKGLECRVVEQWLRLLALAPRQGQRRSQVVEPWVGQRWEAW